MDNTFVFVADLMLRGLTTFFYELSGMVFSHFIQFMFAVLILVMVNIDWPCAARCGLCPDVYIQGRHGEGGS